MKKKVVAIIQARMGSTRLPGKILRDISGKPLLWHVVERLRHCKQVDEIVIATTTHNRDKTLVEFAKKEGVGFYQGSEEDVLSRFLGAAKKYDADVIVRVCSDVPLIDPTELDRLITEIKKSKADFASFTTGVEVVHQGFEVFSLEALRRIDQKSTKKYEREHVIAYFKEHENEFNVAHIRPDKAFEREYVRLSVDTPADLNFMREIYSRLYQPKSIVDLKEVLKILDENPEILGINKHIKQKKIKDGGKRVLFRVDASNEIGFGHLIRMIHLAKHLRDEKNCGVIFAVRDDAAALNKLKRESIPFRKISGGDENKHVLGVVEKSNPDAVVFDLKNSFSPKLVSQIKQQGVLTVSVDNASKAALECDINVIPTAHFTPDSKWKKYGGELYYGPEYVLLAPEFARKKKRSRHKTLSVLVSCGGSDPKNLTLSILKALSRVGVEFKANIVFGPGFKHKKKVREYLNGVRYEYKIIEDPKDMRKLMYKTDIAAITFGVTAYEAAATGLPSVVFAAFERNKKDLGVFAKNNTCINAGYIKKTEVNSITRQITHLMDDTKLQEKLSKRGRKLIDGNGVKRVAEIIIWDMRLY